MKSSCLLSSWVWVSRTVKLVHGLKLEKQLCLKLPTIIAPTFHCSLGGVRVRVQGAPHWITAWASPNKRVAIEKQAHIIAKTRTYIQPIVLQEGVRTIRHFAKSVNSYACETCPIEAIWLPYAADFYLRIFACFSYNLLWIRTRLVPNRRQRNPL